METDKNLLHAGDQGSYLSIQLSKSSELPDTPTLSRNEGIQFLKQQQKMLKGKSGHQSSKIMEENIAKSIMRINELNSSSSIIGLPNECTTTTSASTLNAVEFENKSGTEQTEGVMGLSLIARSAILKSSMKTSPIAEKHSPPFSRSVISLKDYVSNLPEYTTIEEKDAKGFEKNSNEVNIIKPCITIDLTDVEDSDPQKGNRIQASGTLDIAQNDVIFVNTSKNRTAYLGTPLSISQICHTDMINLKNNNKRLKLPINKTEINHSIGAAINTGSSLDVGCEVTVENSISTSSIVSLSQILINHHPISTTRQMNNNTSFSKNIIGKTGKPVNNVQRVPDNSSNPLDIRLSSTSSSTSNSENETCLVNKCVVTNMNMKNDLRMPPLASIVGKIGMDMENDSSGNEHENDLSHEIKNNVTTMACTEINNDGYLYTTSTAVTSCSVSSTNNSGGRTLKETEIPGVCSLPYIIPANETSTPNNIQTPVSHYYTVRGISTGNLNSVQHQNISTKVPVKIIVQKHDKIPKVLNASHQEILSTVRPNVNNKSGVVFSNANTNNSCGKGRVLTVSTGDIEHKFLNSQLIQSISTILKANQSKSIGKSNSQLVYGQLGVLSDTNGNKTKQPVIVIQSHSSPGPRKISKIVNQNINTATHTSVPNKISVVPNVPMSSPLTNQNQFIQLIPVTMPNTHPFNNCPPISLQGVVIMNVGKTNCNVSSNETIVSSTSNNPVVITLTKHPPNNRITPLVPIAKKDVSLNKNSPVNVLETTLSKTFVSSKGRTDHHAVKHNYTIASSSSALNNCVNSPSSVIKHMHIPNVQSVQSIKNVARVQPYSFEKQDTMFSDIISPSFSEGNHGILYQTVSPGLNTITTTDDRSPGLDTITTTDDRSPGLDTITTTDDRSTGLDTITTTNDGMIPYGEKWDELTINEPNLKSFTMDAEMISRRRSQKRKWATLNTILKKGCTTIINRSSGEINHGEKPDELIFIGKPNHLDTSTFDSNMLSSSLQIISNKGSATNFSKSSSTILNKSFTTIVSKRSPIISNKIFPTTSKICYPTNTTTSYSTILNTSYSTILNKCSLTASNGNSMTTLNKCSNGIHHGEKRNELTIIEKPKLQTFHTDSHIIKSLDQTILNKSSVTISSKSFSTALNKIPVTILNKISSTPLSKKRITNLNKRSTEGAIKRLVPFSYNGSARTNGIKPYTRIDTVLFDTTSGLISPINGASQYPIISEYKSLAVTSSPKENCIKDSLKSNVWRTAQCHSKIGSTMVSPFVSITKSNINLDATGAPKRYPAEILSYGKNRIKSEFVDLTEEPCQTLEITNKVLPLSKTLKKKEKKYPNLKDTIGILRSDLDHPLKKDTVGIIRTDRHEIDHAGVLVSSGLTLVPLGATKHREMKVCQKQHVPNLNQYNDKNKIIVGKTLNINDENKSNVNQHNNKSKNIVENTITIKDKHVVGDANIVRDNIIPNLDKCSYSCKMVTKTRINTSDILKPNPNVESISQIKQITECNKLDKLSMSGATFNYNEAATTFDNISRTFFALDRLYRNRKFWEGYEATKLVIESLRELRDELIVERRKQKTFIENKLAQLKQQDKIIAQVTEKDLVTKSPAQRLLEKFSLNNLPHVGSTIREKMDDEPKKDFPLSVHKSGKKQKPKTFMDILQEQRRRKEAKKKESTLILTSTPVQQFKSLPEKQKSFNDDLKKQTKQKYVEKTVKCLSNTQDAASCNQNVNQNQNNLTIPPLKATCHNNKHSNNVNIFKFLQTPANEDTLRTRHLRRYSNPKDPLNSGEDRALQRALALSLKSAIQEGTDIKKIEPDRKNQIPGKRKLCDKKQKNSNSITLPCPKKKKTTEIEKLVDTHWNESWLKQDAKRIARTQQSIREERALHYAMSRFAEMEFEEEKNLSSKNSSPTDEKNKIETSTKKNSTEATTTNLKIIRKDLQILCNKESVHKPVSIIRTSPKKNVVTKKQESLSKVRRPHLTSSKKKKNELIKKAMRHFAQGKSKNNTNSQMPNVILDKLPLDANVHGNKDLQVIATKKEYILVPKYVGFKDFTPIIVSSRTRGQATSEDRDKLKKEEFPLMVCEKVGNETKNIIVNKGEDRDKILQNLLSGKHNQLEYLSTSKKIVQVNRNTGETILHKASRLGYADVAESNIKSGADIHVLDNAGWTALHEACVYGKVEAAKILLKYGADPNCVSRSGIRPLHDAAEKSDIEMVRTLLSYGADPSIASYKGFLPIDCTKKQRMKKLLEGYEADKHACQGKLCRKDDCWTFSGSCDILDDNRYLDIFMNVPAEKPPSIFEFEMSSRPMLTSYYLPHVNEEKVVIGYRNYFILWEILERMNLSRNAFLKKHNVDLLTMPVNDFTEYVKDSADGHFPDIISSFSKSNNEIELVFIGSNPLRKVLNLKTIRIDYY